ncbi:MAG: hypothetical protein M0009_09955 [Deltaproteobacteria bacterium]|nr:hypothetical protein [Deltaproteobacteria bacterium]
MSPRDCRLTAIWGKGTFSLGSGGGSPLRLSSEGGWEVGVEVTEKGCGAGGMGGAFTATEGGTGFWGAFTAPALAGVSAPAGNAGFCSLLPGIVADAAIRVSVCTPKGENRTSNSP